MMTRTNKNVLALPANFSCTTMDPSWYPYIQTALAQVDPTYLALLEKQVDWLPGPDKIFNAFSIPRPQVRYILFGESPYPRAASAIGYAFWDGNVHELWSKDGLSKRVNRATSLRHILKMLLVAEGKLSPSDTSQPAIMVINKTGLVNTIDELFGNLIKEGFLLLNATLVLSQLPPKVDALAWQPFMEKLLEQLAEENPDIKLVLMGKIAERILSFPIASTFTYYQAEHPYNRSFVHNATMLNLFKPMHLLLKRD